MAPDAIAQEVLLHVSALQRASGTPLDYRGCDRVTLKILPNRTEELYFEPQRKGA